MQHIHLKSHRLHCYRPCDRLIIFYRKFELFSSIFLGLHRCRRHSRGCRLFHWLLQTKNPAGIMHLDRYITPTGFLADPHISRRRPLRQTPEIFLIARIVPNFDIFVKEVFLWKYITSPAKQLNFSASLIKLLNAGKKKANSFPTSLMQPVIFSTLNLNCSTSKTVQVLQKR